MVSSHSLKLRRYLIPVLTLSSSISANEVELQPILTLSVDIEVQTIHSSQHRNSLKGRTND